MRPLDRPALQRVRQSDVGLEKVVLETSCALELEIHGVIVGRT